MKNYKLVWEKWRDPFGDDDLTKEIMDNQQYAEEKFLEEMGIESFENFRKQLEEAAEHHDEDEEDIEEPENPKDTFAPAPIKAINTPMGIIPYAEQTASGKIFNFWVGHTNFNITEPVASIIEHCAGTECLDVFTRYRFRVGIGKLFTERDVMADINNRVLAYLESKEVDSNNGGPQQ
jgi:hypothetical protein